MILEETIGKPVISINNAETIGNVCTVLYSAKSKKPKYLCVFNAETTKDYVINIKSIKTVGTNSVLISKQNVAKSYEFSLINLADFCKFEGLNCYNLMGEFLGKVNKTFVESNFEVNNISTNLNFSFNLENIKSISKNNIIIKQNFKSLINSSQNSPQKITIETNKNSNNLVNKTIKNNIYFNHELLFKAGSKVTLEVINCATKLGILNKLKQNI